MLGDRALRSAAGARARTLALGLDRHGLPAGSARPDRRRPPRHRPTRLRLHPPGLDALREQLHAEALRRGLGQAASVLVIGDGAVWIWRLADDRWPQAKQRLDFYHAVQHLVAVGRALWGEDKVAFKAWLKPLVRQLKNESAVKVIRQLEEALAGLPTGPWPKR